jgi:hypothetical protein
MLYEIILGRVMGILSQALESDSGKTIRRD